MKEEFLHYVWMYKKFDVLNLQTTQQEPLQIISGGRLNSNSGPDFFNGQLRINQQLWVGNIEIHVKSSDWYVHGHEKDCTYDNVILHVVYDHDTEIFRKDNSIIPTLVLKPLIKPSVFKNYQRLLSSKNAWINCEKDCSNVSTFVLNNWFERLYIERLERKSKMIEDLLKSSKNDWEAVLFKLLARNFGLKVNGESFFSLAHSIPYVIIRKSHTQLLTLEALLFGQAGLLDDKSSAVYYNNLQKEYQFLKQKFGLNNYGVIPFQFFRLRPSNFPTIRLSQLANLYHREHAVFSKAMSLDKLSDFYKLFGTEASLFWESHFTFSKSSKQSKKQTTKTFMDLLIINTVLPLKFYYTNQKGHSDHENIFNIIKEIASEKNTIVEGFGKLKLVSNSAMTSQALIQLKTEYCDKNKCLKCAIGNSLLSK
ncbi:DUF2851 family protein [uncultured Psychroserpens sp.]|uniref:DUF2851 family protein n=1 Tax=uncultured Psychroserpens sp. TaxID=255436 RepID=UPI002610AB75|nr:DUF2851 family protein [uncultured Psychroserpens sp.]